jgi:Flp pilus assembly protein TadG
VVVALLIVGLVAFLGLIMDGGTAYARRRMMQNGADAAAFAGAREVAIRADNSAATEQKILIAINKNAEANGVPDPNPPAGDANNSNVVAYFINAVGSQTGAQIGLNLSVPANATGVRATVKTTFNTFFLGVVGEANGSAGATAAVQSGVAAPPTKGLMPVGVPLSYVTTSTGSHVIVGQGAQAPSGSSSFRGIINFRDREHPEDTQVGCGDGSKQDAVRYIREGGYNNECGPINYGDLVDALTGNSNGNAGVDAYQTNYQIGDIIVVLVYPDGTIENGTKAYMLNVGFAAMRITGFSSNAMTAQFAGKFVISGPIDPSPPPGSDHSLRAIQFLQ